MQQKKKNAISHSNHKEKHVRTAHVQYAIYFIKYPEKKKKKKTHSYIKIKKLSKTVQTALQLLRVNKK